ncbi:bacillithiol system redox-active protein YtxJ [Cytobacillus spongiae]|jgi:bacillithiol system protein YtxJ|uniref:bacillithiol system redox-active protein YtxJ n=1 Tax=Cytobacillus spongiae TaxID=2901381 RepID=UPI001F3BC4E6|nr:bacillithiol system redox-active protein YtxJ [Cytobacillus spongiae]UII55211.1 bacillithiol system redox-active protein YtxJ [Cytobacillus spongiae]
MKKIDSIEQFQDILEKGHPFFLLKHSLTCPISQSGYEEYESFFEERSDIEGYYLAVQDARPLSNHVAEKFHVKHESPQAILFANKDVAWHASHWKITVNSLTSAMEEVQ